VPDPVLLIPSIFPSSPAFTNLLGKENFFTNSFCPHLLAASGVLKLDL